VRCSAHHAVTSPRSSSCDPNGDYCRLRERSHGRDTQTSVDDRRRRALKTVAALLGAVGLELYSASVTDRSTPHPCQQSRPASEKPSNVARGMLAAITGYRRYSGTLSAWLASSTRSISTRSIRISLPQNGASPSRELSSKTNRPSTTLTHGDGASPSVHHPPMCGDLRSTANSWIPRSEPVCRSNRSLPVPVRTGHM